MYEWYSSPAVYLTDTSLYLATYYYHKNSNKTYLKLVYESYTFTVWIYYFYEYWKRQASSFTRVWLNNLFACLFSSVMEW